MSVGVTSLAEVSLSEPGVLEAAHQPWYELTCSWQHSAEEMAELDIKVSPCSTQHCSTYSLLQWYFGPGDSPFLQWVPGSGTQPQSVDTRAGAGDNLFRSRIQVRTRGLVHVLCDVTRGFIHVLCDVTRSAVVGATRVPEHHGGGGGGHGVQSAAGDTCPPNTATCHVLLPGGARAAAQRAPVRLLHLQGGHLLHRAPVQPHPHHLR